MHKQLKCHSLKHYLADFFEGTLTRINFPNYQNLNDTTEGYDDLIQKILVAINKDKDKK